MSASAVVQAGKYFKSEQVKVNEIASFGAQNIIIDIMLVIMLFAPSFKL